MEKLADLIAGKSELLKTNNNQSFNDLINKQRSAVSPLRKQEIRD